MPCAAPLPRQPGALVLGRLFFKVPIRDFHCGMRAFRRRGPRPGAAQRRAWSSPARSSYGPPRRVDDHRGADDPAPGRAQPSTAPAHAGATAGGTCGSCSRSARAGSSSTRRSPCWSSGSSGMAALAFGPRSVGRHRARRAEPARLRDDDDPGCPVAGLAVVVPLLRGAPRAAAAQPADRTGARPVHPRARSRGGWGPVLAGVGFFVAAVLAWGSTGFGQLDVFSSIRIPIIGMVLMVTGFQLLLVSFTMSLTRVGEP